MLTYKTGGAGADFQPLAAGTYIGICDMVVDVGIQPGIGMYPKPKRQVFIRWQFPAERVEFERDGKKQSGPAVLGKTYTASMNEKANLRQDLEGWRGKSFTDEEAEAFDVSGILGKACMITVTHTQKGDKTYANVTGVGKLMKGIDPKTLVPEIAPIYYAPDNTSTYKQLPEWLQKKIDGQIVEEKSQQEQSSGQPDDRSFITDEDLPAEMFDASDVPF